MKLVTKNIVLGDKRTIVMSDIHGHLDLFKKALNAVGLNKNDVLIIVGDICEKGEDSLGLIQYLMQLSTTHTLHEIMGNCDTVFEDIATKTAENDLLVKNYMLQRAQCLFNEMRKKLGLSLNEDFNVAAFKEKCQETFTDELDFLKNLPHIIESEDYIFVHAGLTSQNLEENDVISCLQRDHFMEENVAFNKYVVVGHWPVGNYNKQINDLKILIDEKKKIIGIDGGCGIKSFGQINILALQNKTMQMSYVDDLPSVRLLDSQEESETSISLSFPDTEIDLMEVGETTNVCLVKCINKVMSINKNDLYPYRGKMYCEDFTDYCIQANSNDIVSLCHQADDYIKVKKHGVIGLYYGEYETL